MMTAVNTMIDKALIDIFHLENIKYVISVDDCFAASYVDKLRQELIVDFSMSPDKVMGFLHQLGKEIDYISQIIEHGVNVQSEIQELINSLSDIDVQKYVDFNPQSKSNLNTKSDREEILYFLDTLKEDGIIDGYSTFKSTHEAEKFDFETEKITNGSILWLIDRNFENVGESSEAGIEFAKNKISNSSTNNFFFILTTFKADSDDEKAVETEFDEIFSDLDEGNASLVYYVSKDKLLKRKYSGVAKNLANGFNRRLYFQIIGEYIRCLKQGEVETIQKLQEIRKKVLDYIFVQKIEANGESYFDFFSRLIEIYLGDIYSSILSERYIEISKMIDDFKKMFDFSKPSISRKDIVEELTEMRKLELYDTHINSKYSEITSGDIFKIRGNYYILSTQPCDTFLRKNGERKHKSNAILLKIDRVEDNSSKFRQDLFCFNDSDFSIDKPAIFFQDYFFIPFEILDLCVANKDGSACIKVSDLNSESKLDAKFTHNYVIRYDNIKTVLTDVYVKTEFVRSFFNNPFISEKENYIDEVKKSYEYIENIDNALKNYKIVDDFLIYDVQRVSRLNELHTISMLSGCSDTLSRVGMPFDYISKNNKEND